MLIHIVVSTAFYITKPCEPALPHFFHFWVLLWACCQHTPSSCGLFCLQCSSISTFAFLWKWSFAHVSSLLPNTPSHTFKLDRPQFYRFSLLILLVSSCHTLHHLSLSIWAMHLLSKLWFHHPFPQSLEPRYLKLCVFGIVCPPSFNHYSSAFTLHATYFFFPPLLILHPCLSNTSLHLSRSSSKLYFPSLHRRISSANNMHQGISICMFLVRVPGRG